MVLVESIHMASKSLHLLVHLIFKITPFELIIKLPLQELTKLRTHKEQFLTWVTELVSIEVTKTSKLIIAVTPHLMHHALLTMNHFIM